MPDALMSSYSNHGGNSHAKTDGVRSVSKPYDPQQSMQYELGTVSSLPLGQESEVGMLHPDKTVAELMIRHLTREISQAHEELEERQEALLRDMLVPPMKKWLFPLMAVGLALSLYGSFAAVNMAGMGATGLMLLWSLGAFWFIYVHDKRLETARSASKAEIEIWSSRIEELEKSLEHHRRTVETTE
jgi:hypothetical protein